MSTEKIIEAIFGVIILSCIGFLGTHIFDMKGLLSSVNSKLELTDNRISRIAEVLPEIKARVAWEEVNEPFNGFILTTNPKEVEPGKWETDFNIYDSESSELKTYSIKSSEEDKENIANTVSGKIRSIDKYAPTFSELVVHSMAVKEPVKIPEKINQDNSFVIRSNNVKKITVYVQKISKQKPTVITYKKPNNNWQTLSKNLDAAIR